MNKRKRKMFSVQVYYNTIINELLRYLINIEKVESFIDDVIVETESKKGHDELVEEYCGNHQTQSLIAAQGSKSLKLDIKWEVHKRTRQGVSAKLESYIYVLHVICANNN